MSNYYKSLSLFASVTIGIHFVRWKSHRMRRETEELQTLRRPEIGGTSVGEEVEWDERTSRDKTGKEGIISTLRWCASARTAYSSFCRVTTGGIRDNDTLVICNAVIGNSHLASDQSTGRVLDLSNDHYYKGIKWCERQRAIIEILFSSRHNFCGNYRQFQKISHSSQPEMSIRCEKFTCRITICLHIDKIDNHTITEFALRLQDLQIFRYDWHDWK